MGAKKWSEEEKQYLIDNWGEKSKVTLSKNLGRSINAIDIMKERLKLGAFLEAGDYITWNQLHQVLGYSQQGIAYKAISWIKNRNFPIHTKRVDRKSFRIVFIDEFWRWAVNNKELLDFSNFEELALGKEPEWVKEKRKHDKEKKRKFVATPWTNTEDKKLLFLLQKYKYTYNELSVMLRRTEGAIQRRICDLGYIERPLTAENHIKWTNQEYEILSELIKNGYGYEFISEKIGKSAKAIRGRVYREYLTENLDKVRIYIGTGRFGENKQERKLKDHNLMTVKEKQEIKNILLRLLKCFEMEIEYKQELEKLVKKVS